MHPISEGKTEMDDEQKIGASWGPPDASLRTPPGIAQRAEVDETVWLRLQQRGGKTRAYVNEARVVAIVPPPVQKLWRKLRRLAGPSSR